MITAEELANLLGPGGSIAVSHPRYEHRPGQIRMAQAVARAIQERQHLCVEAGTGTGKTLAYLLPSLYSGKRVVISTGTKNLQEQLFFKDVPFLERALDRRLPVCYMKGRSNYLCLKKLGEIDGGGFLFSRHDPEYLETIRDWARTTETGDRAELKNIPDELMLWRQLDARRETCTGQKCPDFQSCFVTRVRQRALESDIVIVNHHLFFADLALRQGDFGSVLPDYSVVVFDEAHDLENVATQYFGIMVGNFRVDDLVRDTSRTLQDLNSYSPFMMDQLQKLTLRSGDFFGAFTMRQGRFPMYELGSGLDVRRGPSPEDSISDVYRELLVQIAVIGSALANLPVKSDAAEALERRTAEMLEEFQTIFESPSSDHVYWYESRGRGVFAWASPIEVSTLLSERLFRKVDCAILTSATLATGGNFGFVRSRLGIEQAGELILGSDFDFRKQAIFYIPRQIPEPREQGWIGHACRQIEQILVASRGRAFILFTSHAQMELACNALRDRLGFPVLLQGERSKTAILDAFRSTPNAVLFATSSFWQGVDVQGEALSCVVIDKLPFSVPSDPVVAARIRHVNESGGNAFYEYQVPEAIILLKQGLGRLIRSRTDRGILALLDKRILTKSYGRTFLESLPPAPITHDPQDLSNFFSAV